MGLSAQDEGLRGSHHLEAVRLRVREQKELLSAANKELRCLKKTVKAFEVCVALGCPCCTLPELLARTMQALISARGLH